MHLSSSCDLSPSPHFLRMRYASVQATGLIPSRFMRSRKRNKLLDLVAQVPIVVMLVRELLQGVLELPRACTPSVSHHCKGASVVLFRHSLSFSKTQCTPVFLHGLLYKLIGALALSESPAFYHRTSRGSHAHAHEHGILPQGHPLRSVGDANDVADIEPNRTNATAQGPLGR